MCRGRKSKRSEVLEWLRRNHRSKRKFLEDADEQRSPSIWDQTTFPHGEMVSCCRSLGFYNCRVAIRGVEVDPRQRSGESLGAAVVREWSMWVLGMCRSRAISMHKRELSI